MSWIRRAIVILLVTPLTAGGIFGQQQRRSSPPVSAAKDVDPLALDVLRAVAQPVQQAQQFSLKALISEEQLATDRQIVTFFHTVDVTVQRPDKIHLIFHGKGQRVDLYGAGGTATLYAPDSKLYAQISTKGSIDAMVEAANAKDIDMPIGPFLRSDLYDQVAKRVTAGYVIGRVKVFDQDVHQLAFTSPDADFQLWVTGGDSPRFVRAEIVNKKLEGKPRTIIQFLDWNLSPSVNASDFTFDKPADAHEISIMNAAGGK
jgi:hypothetical protein